VVCKHFDALKNLPAIGVFDFDRGVDQHSQRRHQRVATRFSAAKVRLPNLQSKVQNHGQSRRQPRITLKAYRKGFAKEIIQIRRPRFQRAFS